MMYTFPFVIRRYGTVKERMGAKTLHGLECVGKPEIIEWKGVFLCGIVECLSWAGCFWS